ncbi:hypothetical protein ABIB30_003442 [Pedobacter sp. UYP1]|jgi:hypothetical protein
MKIGITIEELDLPPAYADDKSKAIRLRLKAVYPLEL